MKGLGQYWHLSCMLTLTLLASGDVTGDMTRNKQSEKSLGTLNCGANAK